MYLILRLSSSFPHHHLSHYPLLSSYYERQMISYTSFFFLLLPFITTVCLTILYYPHITKENNTLYLLFSFSPFNTTASITLNPHSIRTAVPQHHSHTTHVHSPSLRPSLTSLFITVITYSRGAISVIGRCTIDLYDGLFAVLLTAPLYWFGNTAMSCVSPCLFH